MNFHWRSASGEKCQFFAKLFHVISVVGLSQMSCPPFIFCGSASPCSGWRSKEVCPLPHEQPLTWSGGCAGGEWHTCVVSSSAGGRGSEGHGGRRVHDPQPPARLNARGNWCKVRHDLPSPMPLSHSLTNGPSRLKALLPYWGRELNLQFLHQSTLWFPQHLLCELLMWPHPRSDWKLTQHFWIIEFLSPALLLWEFWISLLLFLRSNLKFPTTLNKMELVLAFKK